MQQYISNSAAYFFIPTLRPHLLLQPGNAGISFLFTTAFNIFNNSAHEPFRF